MYVDDRDRRDNPVSSTTPNYLLPKQEPIMHIPSRLIVAFLAWGLVGFGAGAAQRGAVYDRVPDHVDAKSRYLIYLHGRIIEEKGRRPTDRDWGVYEYDQILAAMAVDGTIVISEQRPSGTDMDRFAAHVVDQVRQLRRGGVPPEHVSIVGFSKGGGIAIRTSALLDSPRVNFVFLAACGDGDFSRTNIRVAGRILSIYEESDEVGRSCAALFAKADAAVEHSEIQIHVGEHHGTFYRPHTEWLVPLLEWVGRK
jgi:hypothetical protein